MKMKLQPSIVLLLLLVAVRLPSASSDDQLVLGKPLSPSTTIISDGGAFALGFFSPSNSTTSASSRDSLYLGIWYSGITELTVVWVANRESPIVTIPRRPPSASTPSGPTLALTNDSNLVLTDADGRVVWATDVVVAAAHTPGVAVLTNAGNLVLRSPNGTTLWQSFDHPTDTFLPGMKIRIARPGPFLVSWKGPGDPAPGRFAYGIDPSTSLQLFTWNGSRPMWRSGAWTGYSVASEYVASASAVVSLAVVDTDEDSYVAFALSDAAPRTRYVITHSGSLELQSWKSGGAGWHTLGRWPPHDCSRYDYCGPFGYCDNTDAPPACKCLPGFEPASPDEWRSGRFLLGCRRKEELRCGVSNGDGEGFLAVPDMKVPDRFVVIANTGATGCAAECARNCSCVAYAHANLSSSSRGDATRCLVWLGDLIDAKKLGGSAAASDTLHLRVPGVSTAGRKKERNKMKIVLPVIAGVVLVLACLSIVIWACKSKGSKQKHNNFNRLIGLGDLSTCEGFGTGSPNEGFEFSLLSFRDIAALTNNFHTSHMIGQGGFGKVYKAVLDGREVAIKRLSRNSDQGMTEFRNEVVLIAKLQHRNLVSLVGCCSEGDEKLLIYEYMPNKSLDALLFNNSGETMLDWPTRFRIIKGVAKGLLYLHQDSRLKIIHRDLKASNVLLDEEMRPKIADFGMARMFGENQQKADTKRVVGTYGYMAPEYAMRGIFSTKSDVYSFGVLTLEVVSGVKISSTDRTMEFENLIAYAWNLWKDRKTNDLVDSNIVGTCVHDEALLCVQMGLLCVQDNPNDRPTMSYVMFILENISATLPIPNQPVFFAHTNNQVENVTGDTQNSKNNLTLTILEGRKNGSERKVRSGPVVIIWLGSQPRQREAKDGGKGSTRGIGSAVTTTGSARPRRSPAPCRPYTRTHARPSARSLAGFPSSPPFLLLSGPSNPILLPVPLPRPRLDPEGIPPAGRPPSDSAPNAPALDWGRFGIPRGVCLGPKDPIRLDFCPRAGGARPESGAEGVDATRRWIAEPSGVTRATARTRHLRPRPRRRRPCPGRPRRRWGAPRTTSASARRCCRGVQRVARRARYTGAPSGGCSGRTPKGRSSPRSWNSSLVIQATRMMTTWILAYVQSCKYLDAESPVHLAQVEGTSV